MAQTGRSNPDELEWVDFNDFRAGIMFDRAPGSYDTPLGSAQPGGTHYEPATYGCCADPLTGALMPLPAESAGATMTDAPPRDLNNAMALTTSYFPTGHVGYCYTLDARVIGPVSPNVDLKVDGRPEYVAALYAFFLANAGGGAGNYFAYTLGRMWSGVPSSVWSVTRDFHFQKTSSAVTVFSIPAGSLEVGRSVKRADTQPFNISQFRPALAFSTLFPRGNPTNVTTAITATDQTLTTYDNDTGSATYKAGPPAAIGIASVHGTWPDLTLGSNGVTNLERLSQFSIMLVAHQGRIVAASYGPWAQFEGSNYLPLDYIGYNPVPGQWDAPAGTTSYDFLSAVDENPSGFGTAASLNANTFFAVKHYGGGYLIQGDLNNPDIIRLPFIHSTLGVTCHGALTPMGFVYLGRDGAYAFSGGESTKMISGQLGQFDDASAARMWWDYRYDLGTTFHTGSIGRIAWWDPFIVFPNDWVFDTRTNSWWRLRDQSVRGGLNCFDVSAYTGDLFGFPYVLIGGASVTAFYRYDKNVLRSSYQWTSHVIPGLPTEREMELREIDVNIDLPIQAIGSGNGTITFTIGFTDSAGAQRSCTRTMSYAKTTPLAKTVRLTGLTSSAGQPVAGHDFAVTMLVDSGVSGDAAPRVSFRLGFRQGRQIRATVA